MIKKIEYENKVAMQNDEEIPRKNKVTDADLNEIKEVINNNADELQAAKQDTKGLEQYAKGLQAELGQAKKDIGDLEQNKASKEKVEKVEKDLENKVAKEEGKGLSTEDFTTAEKEKLAELENYDDTEVKEGIENLGENKADKTELEKAVEENSRLRKDIQAGTIKGEDAGESLYLADSSDARFRSFEIGGNSRQEAEPSLEFPSPIEAVGQDENLFNKDSATILNAYVENTNNKIVSSNVERIIICPCEPNATYTILKNIKTDLPRFRIDCANKNPAIGDTVTKLIYNAQAEKATVTTTSNAQYLILHMHMEGTAETITTEQILNSIKIVKGTEINGYSPHGQGSVNVTVGNKNVLDVEKFSLVGGTVGYHNKTFVKKLKAGTYTLQRKFIKSTNAAPSAGMVQLHKGSVWFKNLEASAEKITFTIEKDEIMKFIFLLSGSVASETESTIEYYDIQLEKGETTTDYIEHQEQNLTVPVQQPMLEEDKFVKEGGKWYEIHTYKKLNNYTATSAILRTSENRVSINYFVDNIIPNTWTVIKNKAKCNRFKQVAPVNVPNGNCFAVWNGNGNIAFTVDNSYLEDVSTPAKALESWNSLLEQWEDQGESLEMYYQLQAPEKIECTEEQSQELDKIEQTLHSYKGGTHVYSTDIVSSIFNVEYTVDQEAYIKAEIANVTNAVLEIGGNANV